MYPLYIMHTQSQVALPGPLAQGNEDIEQLSKANMLEASNFHKNTMLTLKFKGKNYMIWPQAKKIIRKFPTCSLYNHMHHPLEVTLRIPKEMT